jgi:hypothetical protein
MRQARQRGSQVCGVQGRASSGLGQQLQLQPLLNPEPGGMAISPGRWVFRRVTRSHRPWPCCQAPTNPSNQAGTAAGAAWRSPTVLPGGRACRARSGCGRCNGWRASTMALPIARGELHSKGRLERPTAQVVDGPLGPFSPPAGTQRACADLDDMSMTRKGNQQSRAKRCAHRRFPRSPATVRDEVMRSNSPPRPAHGCDAVAVGKLCEQPVGGPRQPHRGGMVIGCVPDPSPAAGRLAASTAIPPISAMPQPAH